MVYNTWWLRVAAIIIDQLFLLPLSFIGNGQQPGVINWVTITLLVLSHSYFIIGNAQYGYTIGKRLMGLKVVSAHEHLPITWLQAIRRELLWIALSVYYAVYFIKDPNDLKVVAPVMMVVTADIMLAAIHPQNRSLRDFIAGTVVIRHREIEKQ